MSTFLLHTKRYVELLGSRVYLIFFASLFASVAESFGLLMLLPIMGTGELFEGYLPSDILGSPEVSLILFGLNNLLPFVAR